MRESCSVYREDRGSNGDVAALRENLPPRASLPLAKHDDDNGDDDVAVLSLPLARFHLRLLSDSIFQSILVRRTLSRPGR